MKLKIRNSIVTVTGKNVRLAIASHLFKRWIASLDPTFTLHSVDIQSVDIVKRKWIDTVLFLKLRANITDQNGKKMPGIVFLRGDSVAIFIILSTRKDKYVALVKSAMPAIGKKSYLQLPAGMVDGQTNTHAVACREMVEETGLNPFGGDFINLTEIFYRTRGMGVYPSPGACDEMIELFLYENTISEREIKDMQGKATGLLDEGERLTLTFVKIKDLCRMTQDLKAHSAYLMYKILNKEKL